MNVVDVKQSLINEADLKAMLLCKQRSSSRKANKLLKKDVFANNVGECFMCKTNVGIAPFNTRSGTQYMIPANRTMVAVRMIGWYALYLTNGLPFDSVADLKERFKHVRAAENEIRRIDMPVVYRSNARIAVHKMLKSDFVTNAQLPLVQAAYTM